MTVRDRGTYTLPSMAKRSGPPENTPDVEDYHVRLKPFLGIPPTTYVPVGWGVVILLAVFLALVYPGIRSYGTVFTVTTTPLGAEVFVDGVRIGSSPVTAFVAAGERRLEVDLPGHEPIQRTIAVAGRRIASLIVPLREHIHVRFDRFDDPALLEGAAREFAAWSGSGGASAQFQYPPAASEVTRALVAHIAAPREDNDGAGPALGRFVSYFAPHVSTPQAADVLGGGSRLAAAGALFGPDAIAQFVQEIVRYESTSPGAHRVLPVFDGAIEGHPWYTGREASASTELLAVSLALDEGARLEPRLIEIGPISFSLVPAGTYIVGYPAREEESAGRTVSFPRDFWVQSEEVSVALFDEFLSAAPEWSARNRTELIKQGLANEGYLADSDSDSIGIETRAHVSYFAARAFVNWLNERSPYPPLSGFRYDLPTADQWEYAAFLNDGAWRDGESRSDRSGGLGIPIMSGGVWEWTDSWYAIHGRFVPVPIGDQRIVMGGSAVNSDAGHSLRGAQPPDWATPFLGFRIIMESVSD